MRRVERINDQRIELFLDSTLAGSRSNEFDEFLNQVVGRATGLGLTTSNLIRLIIIE